jgi:hypothetical protein
MSSDLAPTTEKSVRRGLQRDRTATRRPPRVSCCTRLAWCVCSRFTGVETIVGLTEDPNFGPLVAFGLGGVSVEVLHDVAFLQHRAAHRSRCRCALARRARLPAAQGYRGRPACDVEALRSAAPVSLIGQHIPEIVELDLNPVIALPDAHGCRIVDARARVAPNGSGARTQKV